MKLNFIERRGGVAAPSLNIKKTLDPKDTDPEAKYNIEVCDIFIGLQPLYLL
jgi:hypothetical protein